MLIIPPAVNTKDNLTESPALSCTRFRTPFLAVNDKYICSLKELVGSVYSF